MRLAIISDIHANLEALTSAFEMIAAEHVDAAICLGDTVGYGANPNECLDLVRTRCFTVLLGNHDNAAFDLSVAERFTHNAQLSARWTFEAITEDNRSFLRGLVPAMHWEGLMLAHASPNEPEEWNYIISESDARDAFRAFDERICFVGHSHVPVIFSEHGRASALDNNNRYLINVGSVGQPRDRNPKLSFGIFDTVAWTYQNVRVQYDIGTASGKIREAGLPVSLADRLSLGV